MALLLLRLNRKYNATKKLMTIVVPKIARRFSGENTISVDVDALDVFTTQLIQKRSEKWGHNKLKPKCLTPNMESSNSNSEDTKIESISDEEMNRLFRKSIEDCDDMYVVHLMSQCIKSGRIPDFSNLLHVVNVCSIIGDKNMIEDVRKVCLVYPDFLEANSNFEHYDAQLIWLKGNVTKSLDIFENVYKKKSFLRRKLRMMFRNLMPSVVTNHSGAVLVNVIDFSKRMLANYTDIFFLSCVWRTCFSSEWYSDQCVAMELLEDNEQLCRSIVPHIPFVVCVSLKNEQTDVVYRLLEVLLKFKMVTHVPQVVIPLLSYQVRKGDLRNCNEIVSWSIENHIEIPYMLIEKYLMLIGDKSVIEEKLQHKDRRGTTPPHYTLKF